jgi:stress response protein YsnF
MAEPAIWYASFDDFHSAEKAVGALLDHGMDHQDVSLIAQRSDIGQELNAEHGVTTTTGADAAAGAGKGAGVGLAVGSLGALASLLIPGFGLVLGGGALATALATAAGTTAAGALAGGVAGFLEDQGVEADTARDYARHVEQGGAVIQVRLPSGELSEAEGEQILHKYNARNVQWLGEQSGRPSKAPVLRRPRQIDANRLEELAPLSDANMTPVEPLGGPVVAGEPNLSTGVSPQRIPVFEEELMVGKREVLKGGKRIETFVSEVPAQEQVSLREERVRVQRRPVNRVADLTDIDAFQEGSFEVLETIEEPVIAKRARVVEEVIISKEMTERVETVHETVRRTDVRIHEIQADFERDYQERFASAEPNAVAASFKDMKPAYEYGHELALDEKYHGADWEQLEANARNEWPERQHRNAWDEVREAVRYGYEKVRNSFSGQRPSVQP